MAKGGERSFLVVSTYAVSFASVFATLLLTELLVSSLFFLAFLETKLPNSLILIYEPGPEYFSQES